MYYLNDLGVLCTLGIDKEQIVDALLTRDRDIPLQEKLFSSRGDQYVGSIHAILPELP